MTMTPTAAVERRFNNLDEIRLKYQLARKDHPRPVSVSGVLHHATRGNGTPVITPPRPRFPRWPMQLLRWLGERFAWEVLWEVLREPVSDVLKGLFRGRRAATV